MQRIIAYYSDNQRIKTEDGSGYELEQLSAHARASGLEWRIFETQDLGLEADAWVLVAESSKRGRPAASEFERAVYRAFPNSYNSALRTAIHQAAVSGSVWSDDVTKLLGSKALSQTAKQHLEDLQRLLTPGVIV